MDPRTFDDLVSASRKRKISMPAYFSVARRLGASLLVVLALAALSHPTAAQNLDADKDGIEDTSEAAYGADPTKADTDGDILTDGFEVYELGSSPGVQDSDDDGLSDYNEWVKGTAPRNPDTDNDGVKDGAEVIAGTDPKTNDAAPAPAPDPGDEPAPAPAPDPGEEPAPAPPPIERLDSDGDGLFDDDESQVYGTKLDVIDTDGDGIGDGEEVYLGTDPLTMNDAPDRADSDGDGLFDLDETSIYGTDPNVADTDGDGVSDGEEVAAGA
jgi:hypothetical protein